MTNELKEKIIACLGGETTGCFSLTYKNVDNLLKVIDSGLVEMFAMGKSSAIRDFEKEKPLNKLK